MPPDTFVALLAQRLAAAIPAGFQVAVVAGDLVISRDSAPGRSGSHVRQFFEALADNYAGHAERCVAAAEHAMSDVQDYVCECTAAPWPAESHHMPAPRALVEDGRLLLWWGDETSPVLRLDPIPVGR